MKKFLYKFSLFGNSTKKIRKKIHNNVGHLYEPKAVRPDRPPPGPGCPNPQPEKKFPEYELVQVHPMHGRGKPYAEVVIRDKNGREVYGGNIDRMPDPSNYY